MSAVARKRSDIARGRPPKTRADGKRWAPIPMEPTTDHLQVCKWVKGRNVLVLGSAPLRGVDLGVRPGELVLVVNGAISSFSGVPDIWLLNSRVREFMHWNAPRRILNQTMLAQCRGRHVRIVGFMNVQDGAEAFTAKRLHDRACTYDDSFLMNRDARRLCEVNLGLYPKDEARKYVLSLGVSAIAMMLWAGARHVRALGFSFRPGYEYLSDQENARMPANYRGHANQDRVVLKVMRARYRDRVTGAIFEEA